jgi:integrase
MAMPSRRKPRRLPHILSVEEVERVLLMTTYAAGLRVSEVARLQLTDLDREQVMIRIEQGKRRTDRSTILSVLCTSEPAARRPRCACCGRARRDARVPSPTACTRGAGRKAADGELPGARHTTCHGSGRARVQERQERAVETSRVYRIDSKFRMVGRTAPRTVPPPLT